MNSSLINYLGWLSFFKKPFFVIGILLLIAPAYADEVSLYDVGGNAVAYVAIDYTVYLWNGEPVAYLYGSGNKYQLYGFNGKHLGWFTNGIVYNNDGNSVGFVRGAMNTMTSDEPEKGFKSNKPNESLKELAPPEPIYSNQFSNEPLDQFLKAGTE